MSIKVISKLANKDKVLAKFQISCRVYDGTSQDDLATLESCTVLDVFQQDLKSKENYKDAILYLFNLYPSLEDYAKCHILPLPADWPGFYYPKKLIAQGRETRISNIVPEQGPFHVYLNAIEDVVLVFKFFFDEMYKFVFGGILPQKPKPFRCSLCVTAALLGWILVRDKVLQKFGLCKSHEFTSIVYLLDHVVPLVFFHYQTFRSGNMDEYECLMAQLAILFISWQRRHYNKSTLSFLSDLAYQKTFLPEYFRVKMQWLSIFTEKKVEVFHSLLRKDTQSFNTGPEIQNTARTIGSSGFLTKFKEWFVPLYQRGNSETNYWAIAGKTAEYLLNLFKEIAANSDKSREVLTC